MATPAPMTADDQTTPAGRATELLRRGPNAPPTPRGRLRNAVRRGLLRAMRPFTHHQHELDAEIVAALRHQQTELEHVGERHAEQIERLEQLARELIRTAESLRRANADAARDAGTALGSAGRAIEMIEPVLAELRAPPYMAGSPFEAMPSPVGEVLGFRAAAAIRGGPGSGTDRDAEYVAFEQLFRGPAERVSELQRPYLPLVKDHEPVLDAGCGRGEFLTLLAGEGIAARGVDGDAGMVARCRALGLDVELGDVNEHLDGLSDRSLGTIFSAQVIEHLPHQELRRMLELSLRKLRPGGLFIAETVNPHRISSLKNFWVDLTHQHPIFPEVALAICAIAGFQSAYVFAPGFEGFERARFDSPAYAVVASAPGEVGSRKDEPQKDEPRKDDARKDDAGKDEPQQDGARKRLPS
jgi:SAM-dependent methyltransferase